jgi:hypothetical protein
MTSGDVGYLSHLIVDQLACALPIKVRAGCGQFLDEYVWRPSVASAPASAGCATGTARPLQARVYGVSVRMGGCFWIGFQDHRTRPLCEPSRCLKVPNLRSGGSHPFRVRGRRDLERGAGSVRPDEPPIPERVVVRLPIQDLTHLVRHAVRISVEHGKQIGPLSGRSVAGQLAFQLLPALPRGPPRRAIRTEKKHPRRKSRWNLPARSCLSHGCLPAGVARCCSSTLHRPEAA